MKYLMITFMRKPNGAIDEQVMVSKRVKPADLQTVNVIVNYETQCVEKCVIESKVVATDFAQLNEYYKKVYPVLIAQLEKANGLGQAEQATENSSDEKSSEISSEASSSV